jgi:hypothetical protein
VCPRRASIDEPTLPYEWPFLFAGLSLVEIGAWKKILDVLSDVNRVRHFFNGRSERKKISL